MPTKPDNVPKEGTAISCPICYCQLIAFCWRKFRLSCQVSRQA